MVLRLAYTDVETGGFDAEVHGLTEVAMVVFDLDTATWAVDEVATFQRYVKPSRWLAYAPGALALQSSEEHGVTFDWLDTHGVIEEIVCSELAWFVEDHLITDRRYDEVGPRIWAQNADFDHGFIRALYQRSERDDGVGSFVSDRCDWGCSRKLFTTLGALGVHDRVNPSMRYIREHYGISDEGAHTALGDARAGVEALRAMLKDLSTVNWG